MKKLFTILAATLLSAAMFAGENDLLWDYTEGAPSSNPDNGLYYASKVTDGPGVKNGLYGIKMNGSGYAYFTKAAVAGKLKLGFGPRSGTNPEKMVIQTWAGDPASATVPTELTSIDTTAALSEYGFQIVELTAEQNNIYIKRAGSVESVLQYLSFTENVARAFTDFKIEFRENPYTVLLPESGELPAGVTVAGTSYNGGQHGIYGGSITVPVDGPVKFTIGACQYSGTPINVQKDGIDFATVDNNAACGETAGSFAQNVLYVYTGAAATLAFELANNTYVPYFFAEATEITPCQIIYKDQNGAELSRVDTYEGAAIEAIPYTVEDLPAIADGNVFRGWYYTSGKKAQVGDVITGNTTIQAKVTPYETVEVGTIQTYDFASAFFYPEDHETVDTYNGAFHDGTHGWYFQQDGYVSVQVAGNAVLKINLCKYSENGDVKVLNAADQSEIASFSVVKNETSDGAEFIVNYAGDETTLLVMAPKQYIHKVVVYNVLDFMEKDAYGYFEVPAGDAASFIMALTQAQPGDKIFLPNGVYDLGETCLTAVTKNNLSIIGQSMEGVIIKNAPVTPGIGVTATILIDKNVTGTYLQDLTIQDDFDYYKNNDGVGVALQDKGTKTVCKNVRLLSHQDTYYSNLAGALKYFEDCKIHGTVDFICGDGSVYFYGTELVCEQRSRDGGGSDALTASNADVNDKGYVFEHCTVRYAEDIQGTKPIVSLGRSWNNKPKTVFLNTFLDDSCGELVMTKDASAQKDKIQRWTLGGMNVLPELFGEYNSVNSNGETISPASNNVTFVLGSTEKQMETILTADQAATYTMAYTLGDWAATAKEEATQAVAEKEAKDFEPNGIYLVEANGAFEAIILGSEFMDRFATYDGVNYTVRKANARGGFGWKAGEEPQEQDIDNCACSQKAMKIIRDGQIVIVRDNKEYNVLGAQL